MKINKLLVAAGLITTVTASAVFADNHAKNQFAAGIKARKAQMQIYAFNMSILGAMAKGQTEYNADAAVLAASNILNAASIHQPQAWAPGSDSSAVEGTRALLALWQNFPDAGAKSAELKAAAEAMKAAAGNGQQVLGGAMGKLGAACGSCHKAYRGQ